jgi:hypothetical protein
MLFAGNLESARAWVVGNLPVAVGGAVAILVLTFLCVNAALRSRRRELDPSKLATAGANTAPSEKALNWEPPEASYADRRGSVRREGQPVRVVLAASTFRSGAADGYVIDRSTGGLKIAVQVAVPPGSTMQVRAADAPDTIGFVTVIVRSCRKTDHHYELGCEFEKTPPWNVLLLFG